MSYSHLRYIAYHLPTIGFRKGGGVEYGLSAGSLLDHGDQKEIFSAYPNMHVAAGIVNSDNVLAGKPPIFLVDLLGPASAVKMVKGDGDVFVRVQRLLTALELAATTVKNRKDLKKDGVLNLFVAPEFYFRPPEEPHSYTAEMHLAIANVLKATIGEKEALEHWLVVPGTIMWTEQYLDTNHLEDTAKRVLIDHNCTYVINGGVELIGGQKIDKYTPSKIDGLPSQRLADGEKIDGVDFDGDWLYRAEFMKRKDLWPSFSDHVVSFGGVKMGVEICKDHGVLRCYPRTTGNISAQLVVACGRTLLPACAATLQGGIVMRCDGHHGPGIRWDQRVVSRYDIPGDSDRWDEKAKAVFSPSTKDLMGQANPYVQLDIPFGTDHPLNWKPSAKVDKEEWVKYKQGLTFYSPQAV